MLELGLGGRLAAAVGTAQAKAILFGPQPVTAERLAEAALSPCRRIRRRQRSRPLAGSLRIRGAHLLVRSLRAAARSTPAQAAAYDSELLQLLGE